MDTRVKGAYDENQSPLGFKNVIIHRNGDNSG